MKKVLTLLLVFLAFNLAYSQPAIKHLSTFSNLGFKLHTTFVLVDTYIKNAGGCDNKHSMELEIASNCYSANEVLEQNKKSLILKLGQNDYDQLVNQFKNYDQATSKGDLTDAQLQSAMLWLKLSEDKVKELTIKLLK